MNKGQANMWENDARLVPETPEGSQLCQDMLFNFVKSCNTKPEQWLTGDDIEKYKNWESSKSKFIS